MNAVADAIYIGNDRKRGPIEFADRVVQITRVQLYRRWAVDGVKRVAEIGVADGRNALAICEAIPDVDYLGVDPWKPYRGNPRGGPPLQHEFNLQAAIHSISRYRATLRNATSMEAVAEVPLESLDAVYIDGNHSFDWVMQDVIEWSKRVRPGGYVAGHDFYEFKWAGVVDAVVAYTKAHDIIDWHITDEREPSFWWVKP